MDWTWWLLAVVILGIIELLTVDFFFLMLAIAALAGAGASAAGAPLWVQVVLFAVAAVLLLILVRPWARAHLARSTPKVDTNAQGLVAEAVVTETVNGRDGRIRLAGDIWSARTEDDREVPVDAEVTVVRISGATAIVAPLHS